MARRRRPRARAEILALVVLVLAAAAAGCGGEPAAPSETAATVPVLARPGPAPEAAPGPAGPVHHVSPGGDDAGPGDRATPWRTLQHALSSLRPGDTLIVDPGEYVEDVRVTAREMHPGTPDQPIRIEAAPGGAVVVVGLLWLTGPSYWHIDGIDVTWGAGHRPDEHMVKVIGGEGWSLTGAELSGARSYAALLVAGGARRFRVAGCFIHDTHPSNDQNQDHLVYIDNGHDGSGVVEDNVLARAPNGRGVKIGPGSLDQPGTDGVVVRHNTFFDNEGPSNVQLSGSSSGNRIVGNIFHTAGPGATSITTYHLTGGDNVVADNLWWGSEGVADFSDPGVVDGRGNVRADPLLRDPGHDDFRPALPNGETYGASLNSATTWWTERRAVARSAAE